MNLALVASTGLLKLNNIEYLGGGAYSCQLIVDSNGFHCDRPFSFDNDEYFVAKAWEVVKTHTGEADLMDLQADSYIRFKPFNNNTILVCGFIVEETNVTQSLEFAFGATRDIVETFIHDFEKMVRANI